MIVHIDDVPFAVRVDGADDKPPMLISNSLSSDMTMWDDQVPHWLRSFRVVRYDARGHGGTPPTPGPYTMERLARDALGILDVLGIPRAHFCGLSMGGMVGMWLATNASDRLDRVVLANTSAHMGPRSLWDGRIELAQSGGIEATVEPTLARWFPQAFHRRVPAAIERMRAMIRRTSLQGYVGCCEAIRDMDQRETIRAIRNPVLLIIGASDPATTPVMGRQIREAIPGSQVTMIDAAHISCVEQPETFTQLVSDFLLRSAA